MKYIQCELVRKNVKQISGIPEEYTKLGNILKLRGEDGWKVTWVGGEIIPYSDAIIRSHRKATGDSLPK